ncbi:hypothetical protein U9M48_031228 [Paspalum notatum var. saurae]|uniref:Uncharacterized protein n=1 Tax=Paspalum notatum var. saurae TaxID=547442 RepID=A0AAQ3X458_PASNO
MGQLRPRRRFPKVSRFLTSKPGVQRRIGLLATWRTSEDCVEAKKIKSSSWSSVPDISALSSKFRRVRAVNHRTVRWSKLAPIGLKFLGVVPYCLVKL